MVVCLLQAAVVGDEKHVWTTDLAQQLLATMG
jgi:hypothetical protein